MLDPGRNCWLVERADRAAVVVDAADYFKLVRQAMLRAQTQILLIGWDFDTRIILDRSPSDGAPGKLGPLLSWLGKHRPDVSTHILRWDLGAPKLLARGTTVFRLIRWAASKQITFKLDGAHPFGASHHQKIVVIDDKLAFCGGIDMTAERWDTREHGDHDPRRKRPTTGRIYQPWHDATMAVDGPAAAALGRLARDRWEMAGGLVIPAPQTESDPWPDQMIPNFRAVDVGIARTRGAHKGIPELREIEALYLDMISAAKRFIYAESQFFASRVIAEAIAGRLSEPNGPECIVINPKVVQGWIYEEVMSPARAELVRLLADADRYDRFRVYTPVNGGAEDIYVHSKITIIDDEILRVGSANLNNRSMGLDSECDLVIDGLSPANEGARSQIAALRNDLLAEHLDVLPQHVEAQFIKTGSLLATIESLRGEGRTLIPLNPGKLSRIEAAIAESELFDPESAGAPQEPPARPGLVDRL